MISWKNISTSLIKAWSIIGWPIWLVLSIYQEQHLTNDNLNWINTLIFGSTILALITSALMLKAETQQKGKNNHYEISRPSAGRDQ